MIKIRKNEIIEFINIRQLATRSKTAVCSTCRVYSSCYKCPLYAVNECTIEILRMFKYTKLIRYDNI